MKTKNLRLIAFLAVVSALVGCQKKTEDNPPEATNGAASAATPGSATWNNTNSSPMPTNPVNTNNPAVTNQ